MLYKSVFFGYIAAAIAVVAALVLIVIMLHQDRQYERKKLLSLTGVLAGSICMNTLYFLSYFDSLTEIAVLYAPVERALDILCSFVINLFILLFFYYIASGKTEPVTSAKASLARRLLPVSVSALICATLFAVIVYEVVVTDKYTVTSGHLVLAETGQIILTAVICIVTILYTWLAVRGNREGSEPNARARLARLIVALGIVNVVTAIYNGIGSMAMFRKRFDYIDWTGVNDFNTWFFILSDVLVLLIVIWYFGRQAELSGFAFASAEGAGQPLQQWEAASEPMIPESLGLTPREAEITELILQRQTYREIAEQLTISEHTVKRHVHNIYEKAGVSRRDELIKKLKQE